MQFRSFPGLAIICALALGGTCLAKEDPVQWTLTPASGEPDVAPGSQVFLALRASIQPGWHLYSPTTPSGGPNPTQIRLEPNPVIAGYAVYRPQPIRRFDSNFQLETETYTGTPVFYIDAQTNQAASAAAEISAQVRYQVCSDVKCLPPVHKTASTHLRIVPQAPSQSFALPPGYELVPQIAASAPSSTSSSSPVATHGPISGNRIPASSQDLLPYLLAAFGFGLAALFTPCVFPMIPITVSFFLNQSSSGDTEGRRPVAQALVFCLGIIVLFTGLGLLVTAIAGPFGVVQLGSNPWVNGFIALVFFVFSLSLLGAFEFRLPSGLLTRLNQASSAGGFAGTLLMGLTFSLTSFACIGPIVGPLLIASVQSKGAAPVLGMLAFSTGLAAPFFLLALFPSYLKRLPRSGTWMVRVKIVLGFIVLAVMLKYLSNVDQVLQTRWLTRDRFLAAWIVLFALPGLYLLGFVRMQGVERDQRIGVWRALIASVFLIFSLSLLPGLFGARLGDLDAFVPEPAESFSASPSGSSPQPAVFKNNLAAALAAAREQKKLVLVDFTGYACTNCHWMKANMFTRPEIQAALTNLIVVDLYTDGTDAASEQNQKLEDEKFGTASIPFYALMDADQKVIATFPQLTRNPAQFLAFLNTRPAKTADTAMLR
jgi:thiol:disulfide interchange protein